MKEEEIPNVHVFICERCESPNGCPKKFRKDLKQKSLKFWTKKEIRINAAGCLGLCDSGINAIIYPYGKLLKNLGENDTQTVISTISALKKY